MTIHKKQNKSNLSSYHPISLLSIISTVMEGVTDTIKLLLISNNLLADSELVFSQGHSAPYLITALMQTQTTELNSGCEVRVTALDIKAAFDPVRHQGAREKLKSMEMREKSSTKEDSCGCWRSVISSPGHHGRNFSGECPRPQPSSAASSMTFSPSSRQKWGCSLSGSRYRGDVRGR